MSVDTYLKGKDTSRYSVHKQDDVKILIAPRLVQWAKSVHLDTKRFLFWDSFNVEAEHRHTQSCRH